VLERVQGRIDDPLPRFLAALPASSWRSGHPSPPDLSECFD
jgi:hypothetical protein